MPDPGRVLIMGARWPGVARAPDRLGHRDRLGLGTGDGAGRVAGSVVGGAGFAGTEA